MSGCESEYIFVIFDSVKEILSVERIIKEAKLPYKMVPIPTRLSPECGMCIRLCKKYKEKVEALLLEKNGKFRIEEIEDKP